MGKVSTRHSHIVERNNRLVGCGSNNVRGARERVAGGDLERGRSKTSVDLDGFSHHVDSHVLSPFWLKHVRRRDRLASIFPPAHPANLPLFINQLGSRGSRGQTRLKAVV